MKNISFRFPTSIRDIKVLWKEYTSKRYRKNIDVMRKMTDFYIRNVLKGRWGEVADGKVVKWSDGDKRQFEREMILQDDEFRIENDGIWISKKAIEECKKHYCKVADKFKPKPKMTEPDCRYTLYLGKADVYNDLLKHFEPLEP